MCRVSAAVEGGELDKVGGIQRGTGFEEGLKGVGDAGGSTHLDGGLVAYHGGEVQGRKTVSAGLGWVGPLLEQHFYHGLVSLQSILLVPLKTHFVDGQVETGEAVIGQLGQQGGSLRVVALLQEDRNLGCLLKRPVQKGKLSRFRNVRSR